MKNFGSSSFNDHTDNSNLNAISHLDSFSKEFDEINDFFKEEEDHIDNLNTSVFDQDKGYIRKNKRKLNKFIAFEIINIELSYLQLDNNHPSISSQIGFSIENIKWNEVKLENKLVKIFDNDLDSFKNIGLKVIFLKNTSENESAFEIYLKIESIKIKFSHLSVTFGYVVSLRLTTLL